MIWGETDAEFYKRVCTQRRWFAWHPVRLNDGRIAFFHYVVRVAERVDRPYVFWQYWEEIK